MTFDRKAPPSPPAAMPPEEPEPAYGIPPIVYTQILFWLSSYITQRAERTGLTTDQLIEEFGVNLRKTINPKWRPQG